MQLRFLRPYSPPDKAVGARAETSWLPDDVIRDQWNYVCTGRDVMDLLAAQATKTWTLGRDPYLLETSVPGIFAVGDVRHGSIKRVASGVGEGSMAIAFVHHIVEDIRLFLRRGRWFTTQQS